MTRAFKVGVLSVAVAFGWMSMARASCDNARLISGCLGNQCAYISSAGQSTAGLGGSIRGSYWGLGGGNTTVGQGDDSGILLATGNPLSSDDWVKSYFGQNYFAGVWSLLGVDGCVDASTTPSPKRTVIALSDASPPGPAARGYFSLVCKEKNSSTANYDMYLLGVPTLVEIPYPRFQTSSRVAGVSFTATIKNAAASITGGVLADPSCTPLIRGYKLFTQVRANSSGEPGSRVKSGWTQQGSELPINQDSAPVTVACGPGTSVYMATGLVFESGFETQYVSKHVRMPCDPTLADRPGSFRLIKKPRERQ